MNDSISTAETEFVWRRLEEPLHLFGTKAAPWVWFVILGVILAVGLFYIIWMYIRDGRSVGPAWATFLGLLRASVYVILCAVFLMPAKQTWHRSTQRTKVVLLFDVSRSMESRDAIPGENQTFNSLPTRTDLLMERLTKQDFAFIRRLEANNPITAYRFARDLDSESLVLEKSDDGNLHFWQKAEMDKIREARSKTDREEQLSQFPGRPLHHIHWNGFFRAPPPSDMYQERRKQELDEHPYTKFLADADARRREWGESSQASIALKNQIEFNKTKDAARFYDATAVGEAVQEVLKLEAGQMVEGIVLFTDGRLTEGASGAAVLDAAKAAAKANVPLFVVQVGEVRRKVTIDIVDISVAPIIRPEDKFRIIVSVTGHDIPDGEPFDISLDVSRLTPDKEKKDNFLPKPIELVDLDEKGNIVLDKDGKEKTRLLITDPSKPRHTLTLSKAYAKEPPVFKGTNPPTCQVEYELDAATLVRAAAGKPPLKDGEKPAEGEKLDKIGLAPDDDAFFRFVARIPKDKREISSEVEHRSENAEMRVMKKAMRVLVVTSAATKDYQFLRSLLVREADKGRGEVSIFLQPIEGGEKRSGIVQDIDPKRMLNDFPTKRSFAAGDPEPYSAYASYDVVVLIDPDWKEASPQQIQLLSEWVEKDGGGLIYIGGQLNTQDVASPLNLKAGTKELSKYKPLLDMLPVTLEYSQKDDATSDVPRRLLFPQADGNMEFMRLEEGHPKAEWEKGWQLFFDGEERENADGSAELVLPERRKPEPDRGIFSYYPVKRVKDNALRLASIDSERDRIRVKGPDGRERSENQPWLASSPWGKGKVVWLGSGETWRLRMFKEAYHERFWTKLLRDVGSSSINTLSRRITPNMSRYGQVNKFQQFEARFEDVNGNPLKNSLEKEKRPLPKLFVTLPQHAEAQPKQTVVIKLDPPPKIGDDKTVKDPDQELRPYDGKTAIVLEVKTVRDAGKDLRVLVLGSIEGADKGLTLQIDSKKVQVQGETLVFRPKLGPDERNNKENDGVFKVDFQPKVAGVHQLKVVSPDGGPGNEYNHKFDVRETNPETENVKPDIEVLWALATPSREVLKKPDVTDETKRKLRAMLKRPEGLVVKAEKKPEARGEEERAASDDSTRLLFELKDSDIIPDCMTKRENNLRNRGKIDDMWDHSLGLEWSPFYFYLYRPEQGEFGLPLVLLVAVSLLSIEWLTRKLLRLA